MKKPFSLIELMKTAFRWVMPLFYLSVGGFILIGKYLEPPMLSTAMGGLSIIYGIYRCALLLKRGGTKPLFAIAVLVLAASGCNKESKPVPDSPTRGKITIAVDESYRPVIDAQVTVFDSLSKKAQIMTRYEPMGQALSDLLLDSVQVAILPRALSEEELQVFKRRGFTPQSTMIARDGLALIVHPSNPDSVLTVDLIRQMLTGVLSNWKQLGKDHREGQIRIVFDNEASGSVQYAIDSICRGHTFAAERASAVQSSEEVIAYVAKNPDAIGFLGVNWISDMDDPQAQAFMRGVRVVAVARMEGEEAFQPYQAYLATKQYPFIRDVFIINAQARSGLGLGFSSFLASVRGQRIVLKSGLLPATQPIRLGRFHDH